MKTSNKFEIIKGYTAVKGSRPTEGQTKKYVLMTDLQAIEHTKKNDESILTSLLFGTSSNSRETNL
jgi:hypothetical protein